MHAVTSNPEKNDGTSRGTGMIRALAVAAAAFISSRLTFLLVGWITLTFINVRESAQHGISATSQQLLGLTCRWDCGWYMSIAQNGYSTISPATQPHAINLSFWPAFPFLARLLSNTAGISVLVAGVIIANLAFLVCLYLLHRYCTLIGLNKSLAAFAVFLLAFVPESFLFSAFYADSMSMAGMLGAMYFARKKRWWIAGLFAVLASSSRPTGVAVIFFLVANAYEELGWRGFLQPWRDARPFVPVVLAPAGYFLMLWISFKVSGDAFAEVHTRAAGWGVHFAPPFRSLVDNLALGPDLKFWIIGALVMLTSVVPLIRVRLLPDVIFVICYFVLIFSQNHPAGLIHYAAGLPAIYAGFALMCDRHQSFRYALLAIFAATSAALFCAWTLATYISV